MTYTLDSLAAEQDRAVLERKSTTTRVQKLEECIKAVGSCLTAALQQYRRVQRDLFRHSLCAPRVNTTIDPHNARRGNGAAAVDGIGLIDQPPDAGALDACVRPPASDCLFERIMHARLNGWLNRLEVWRQRLEVWRQESDSTYTNRGIAVD